MRYPTKKTLTSLRKKLAIQRSLKELKIGNEITKNKRKTMMNMLKRLCSRA